MYATRRILTTATITTTAPLTRSLRRFHASPRQLVQVGDAVPDVELMENSPGNRVSLAHELAHERGLIIGVPAAFSPGCSATHIPGYINAAKLKSAGQVFVVSVNDAFVMKAWASSLDPEQRSKIRFLADPQAAFTTALDLSFDATAIFGQPRSKRYALVTEGGKVTEVHVEPDNTGIDVSAAEKVLK